MKVLEIQGENPVVLRGYLDAAGAFQLTHRDGALPDYSQTLYAVHETATSITIELHDFDGWQLSATHGEAWTRGTGCVYFSFSQVMTDPVEVAVKASNGTQALKRNIYVKAKPKGSLPAH